MPDKNDSWQFNCKIKLLQNYFYTKEVGFTATDAYLSAMVREGLISRLEAWKKKSIQSKISTGSWVEFMNS